MISIKVVTIHLAKTHPSYQKIVLHSRSHRCLQRVPRIFLLLLLEISNAYDERIPPIINSSKVFQQALLQGTQA